MMHCDTIAERLDAWLDGELPAAEKAEVEAHLSSCANCRVEAEAIRSIVADARALPRSIPPAGELWTGIGDRVARSPRQQARPLRRFGLTVRWSPWTRLAAALALMLFGAALATLWQRRSAPAGFAAEQARYTAASAELARKLAADPGVLGPATRVVVERNLVIIDQAIREAELALAADPGNTALERMLIARYAQRMALLQRATDAGRRES